MPDAMPAEGALGRRRSLQAALRVGAMMLAGGAQVQEVETAVRTTAAGLGLADTVAVVSVGAVSVSYTAPGDAEPMTAIKSVPTMTPDFHRLAELASLIHRIPDSKVDAERVHHELDLIEAVEVGYPAWIVFAAPALLSFFVTLLFRGSLLDALTTLVIGLVIQPLLVLIEQSTLPAFFQVAFGVTTTTLVVVLLVRAGMPIEGSLVLTGSLLRFLPGAQLVAGMHDLIGGAVLPGVANLAQVALLGASVAGAASLMLAFGAGIGVELTIDASGIVQWPWIALVGAGAAAVAMSAVRSRVPRSRLASVTAIGAVAVTIAQGVTPLFEPLQPSARTLASALVVGIAGTLLAHRSGLPTGLWTVPAILPLLPAPATLLPLLADSQRGQNALQGQAIETAFAIGVGVAAGSILITTWLRFNQRLLRTMARQLNRLGHPPSPDLRDTTPSSHGERGGQGGRQGLGDRGGLSDRGDLGEQDGLRG